MSTRYDDLLSESSRYLEQNDCTVIALAVITGASYETCWKVMRHHGRRPRCGAQMLVQINHILALFHLYATTVYQKSHRTRGFSFMTANQRFSWRKRYLLFSASHVAAMVNGTIHDWAANRRHPVRYVLEISELESC